MDRKRQQNVFVAYTPYHIFISLIMALSGGDKDEDQHLIIVSNFSDAQLMYKSLLSCPSLPFKEIVFYKGEYNLDILNSFQRKFARFLGVRRICRDLVSHIKHEKIDKVYLFNEDRAYSLAILDYVSKQKGAVKASFVEDGTTNYSSYIERKKMPYLIFGKIFYGLWWKNVPVMGTSKFFDENWAFFPDFVRPELSDKVKKQIPLKGILELERNQIAARVLLDYEFKLKDIQDLNAIILLSHSSVIARFPEYKSMLLRVIQKAQSLGYKVDSGSDFLNLNNQPNVTRLRSSAPLEFIFILARDNIQLVVSDLSTTALTARLLLNNAKIVSAGVLLGSKDERFLNMLDALGVKLPKSFEEFDQYL